MMKCSIRIRLVLFAGLIFQFATGCREQSNTKTLLIALSKASNPYISWLQSMDSTIRYVNLYPLPLDSALDILNQCDGLLLTGGDDIYPGIYDFASDTARCESFDLYRDTLEINLIQSALDTELPILGICRGEQLLNAVFGGTLYTDIPLDLGTLVQHRCEDYLHCTHTVYITPHSQLHAICGCDSGIVTTNHHQGIRVLASNLQSGALTSDSLIEAIELKESQTYSFFLAVQWHPERMDTDNPLSGLLLDAFIKECRAFQKAYH